MKARDKKIEEDVKMSREIGPSANMEGTLTTAFLRLLLRLCG
jgi:hypothetical protein